MNKNIKDIIFGMVIGAANIIPGVSGGTMALILGIYERLIAAINNISVETVKLFLNALTFNKEKIAAFKNEFIRIDGPLLLKLGCGAGIAIIALAKLMSFLLINKHDATYGFFFGLVLISVYSPYSLIKKKSVLTIIFLILAVFTVVGTSEMLSGEKMIEKAKIKQQIKTGTQTDKKIINVNFNTKHILFIFFSGAIAISAMILPGISGSFVMLLMGTYFEILKAISSFNIITLAAFSVGCLAGIIFFTRILNFLLNKFYDVTMSYLLGLVIGSLWVIWPFKNSVIVGTETIYLSNIIPPQFGGNELTTLITFIIGAVLVLFMLRFERK